MNPNSSDNRSFTARYLEPSERMSELLFGLIMTLTFTLGASLVIKEGPDATRELLVGVIGCNIAWGVIDGLLYIMNSMYSRGKVHRAARILHTQGENAAGTYIKNALDEVLDFTLSKSTTDSVVGDLISAISKADPGRVKLNKTDMLGAIASFWLVVCTAIPAVVPFLFIDNHLVALRVSNTLLIALMFGVGYVWAKFIHANPWVTGIGMIVFGVILVQVTIFLGG